MFLQNIRKVVPASIVAMARQGIVFLPLLFIKIFNTEVVDTDLYDNLNVIPFDKMQQFFEENGVH